MSWKSTGCKKLSSFLLFLALFATGLGEPVSAQGRPTDYPSQQTLLNRRQNQISMINAVRPGWTSNQRNPQLNATTNAPLTPAISNLSSRGFRNNLPPTKFDSFVLNAGAHAEHIYGDENIVYDRFTEAHRINTGIVGDRDSGLTTGHGSVMPNAWGRDEFTGGTEMSQSGRRGFESNEQAIRSNYDRTNSWNEFDYDKVDKQFYNGAQELEEEPVNPYWAEQEADRKIAEQQVADAYKRYDAMNKYK